MKPPRRPRSATDFPSPPRPCPTARPRRYLPFHLWLVLGVAWFSCQVPAAEPAKTNAAAPVVSLPADGKSLFDGNSLLGWKVTAFGGHGEVEVKESQIVLSMGALLTGIQYTNPVPKVDYEVSLEAMRVSGSDFFCGLTVPVNDSHCTLILGGWGGGLTGISSLDGYDASENDTTRFQNFQQGKWYSVRLRVTKTKIQAWVDQEKIVDTSIVDRRVSLRAGEIEMSIPFGIATFQTTAAIRNVRIRPVSGPA